MYAIIQRGKKMIDQYGRSIDYIRISVTDRCNLRCIYCMPEDGEKMVSHQEVLTYDEIIRIVKVCSTLGIHKVKLTGGEPLVRKNLSYLVKRLKSLPQIEQVTLTTNGILLKEQIDDLVKSGLDAVNISLDTLDREMFYKIARRDQLKDVLEGIQLAAKYKDLKVKINCVLLAGINDTQWKTLALLAKNNPIDVRFIEMMPIGLGGKYEGKYTTEVHTVLKNKFGKERAIAHKEGNGPSTYVTYEGFKGNIGFISAISHQFCSSCNRIRLTSLGILKPCLQYSSKVNLKEAIRDGMTDEHLQELIQETIYYKPKQHQFNEQQGSNFETVRMSKIGG